MACAYTEGTNAYAIALDGQSACVILDSTGSSDVDTDPLEFRWVVDGTTFYSGAVVTNCLELGCHTVTLWVSDALASVRCEANLCMVTACEAVEQCIVLVDGANLARKNKRPLIATLKAACASFDRGDFTPAMNQLNAFQNKVRAQICPEHPAECRVFIDCAQRILDAIECIAITEIGGIVLQ